MYHPCRSLHLPVPGFYKMQPGSQAPKRARSHPSGSPACTLPCPRVPCPAVCVPCPAVLPAPSTARELHCPWAFAHVIPRPGCLHCSSQLPPARPFLGPSTSPHLLQEAFCVCPVVESASFDSRGAMYCMFLDLLQVLRDLEGVWKETRQ